MYNEEQLNIWNELLLCGEVVIHDDKQLLFHEILEQSEDKGYIITEVQSSQNETVYRLVSIPSNTRFFADKLVYAGVIIE